MKALAIIILVIVGSAIIAGIIYDLKHDAILGRALLFTACVLAIVLAVLWAIDYLKTH
jgi:hypothetical protein